uniref:Uncharacterized protein n=1 Tax=Anguilla anguilla TaxID=7936 RepID=A0A0E9SLI6_ANGAN
MLRFCFFGCKAYILAAPEANAVKVIFLRLSTECCSSTVLFSGQIQGGCGAADCNGCGDLQTLIGEALL